MNSQKIDANRPGIDSNTIAIGATVADAAADADLIVPAPVGHDLGLRPAMPTTEASCSSTDGASVSRKEAAAVAKSSSETSKEESGPSTSSSSSSSTTTASASSLLRAPDQIIGQLAPPATRSTEPPTPRQRAFDAKRRNRMSVSVFSVGMDILREVLQEEVDEGLNPQDSASDLAWLDVDVERMEARHRAAHRNASDGGENNSDNNNNNNNNNDDDDGQRRRRRGDSEDSLH